VLTNNIKKDLLKLARKSIISVLKDEKLDLSPYKKYSEKRAVFVTLNKNNDLRGCIGYIQAHYPSYLAVRNAARQAAFEDPRFEPVTLDEVDELEIEISVLTPLKEVFVNKPEDYLKKIIIGKHGLLIKKGCYQGLLLPQVPVDYGWNQETFLENLCLKAGMMRNDWKEPGVKIYNFEAVIFQE